ncbi:putative reverse transcriptase domain-containing protein [Tanacetum coccineum]
MLVEMTDMSKNAPLGIVENVLVKINKFVFLSDFVIIDMLGDPNQTMILGRPFLATIHARINIFHVEISLGIGEDRILFDMNENVHHPTVSIEKVYMANSIQEEESFNPLEIESSSSVRNNDLYSRDLEEYKSMFDNEITQLANEYELRIGKKGYNLENIWENVSKFMEERYIRSMTLAI